MLTSKQTIEAAEAKGLAAKRLSGGTSYRSGGDIVVGTPAFWSGDQPAKLVERGKAFDGAGRGRKWCVVVAVPDADGMVPCTLAEYRAAPSGARRAAGNPDGKSGQSAYFCRPGASAAAIDEAGDSLFGDLLAEAVPEAPVVVTRSDIMTNHDLRQWRAHQRHDESRPGPRPHGGGASQAEVAATLGVSVRTYQNWEQGSAPVPGWVVAATARIGRAK